MPVLSLGVLYVFAVLPVAVLWGTPLAVAVSVASMLTFNWFFLPPTHTFQLADEANWAVLTVYLVTAVVVGALAARARRRAELAERREREATALAAMARDLLHGIELDEEVPRIGEMVAGVLGVAAARIEVGTVEPAEGERAGAARRRRDAAHPRRARADGLSCERASCRRSRRCSRSRSSAASSRPRRSRRRRCGAATRSRRRCSTPSRTTSARR